MLKRKFVFLVFAVLIALSGFVIADHVIKTSGGGTNYSYNDSTANVYNLTVNNTDATATANITQVNITLPSGFSFVSSSNLTDSSGTFTNSGSTLTWQNSAGLVMNLTLNYFSFRATSSIPGSYNLTIATLNATGAFNSNISVTINDTTSPTINYTTPSSNNTFYNVTYLIFNVTAQDYSGIDALTLRVYNASLTLLNTTTVNSSGLPLYLNLSNLTAGTYYYNVTVNDTKNNVNNSVTRQTMIDITSPGVSIPTPTHTETTINLTVSITESGSGISSCTSNRGTASGSGTSWSVYESGLTCATSYTYNVTCTDNAGNSAKDSETHTTSTCTDSDDEDSSGGGGSEDTVSFWTSTFAPSEVQLRLGYNRDIKKGERVKVKIGNETHYVGIIKLTSNEATINVSSTPQQAILRAGDGENFEVTNDSYYDINVTLNSVNSTSANVTVLYIHEVMPEGARTTTTTATAGSNGTTVTGTGVEAQATSTPLYKRVWFWVLIVLIVLVAAGGGYFYYARRKRTRVAQGLESPSPSILTNS